MNQQIERAIMTMKTRATLTIAALTAASMNLSAQNAARLEVQTYAGVTITGDTGSVYSIEYVTGLAEPAESDWRCLEFLRLPTNPYLWTDKSVPVAGDRFYRAVAMQAPADMVFIPPGTFRMGSAEDEVGRYEWERPQMDVIISRGFWMGKYEVTQREYLELMGGNPSGFSGDLSRPVETVSWSDALAFCSALTLREHAAKRIQANCVYRLPTEAEWEYASRAWTSTRFSYGDDAGYAGLTDYAWYENNSGGETHPVGQKLPNPWGLYDMHGNVWEWCHDWFGDYSGGILLDPQGPSTGATRVARGGDWGISARSCRLANIFSPNPDDRQNYLGFRIVLAPGQP